MKTVMMKGVMTKLEEKIPMQLAEKAGFEAECSALLPADFPGAFFALIESLGVNGLPLEKKAIW